jgi:hypothetical protein
VGKHFKANIVRQLSCHASCCRNSVQVTSVREYNLSTVDGGEAKETRILGIQKRDEKKGESHECETSLHKSSGILVGLSVSETSDF